MFCFDISQSKFFRICSSVEIEAGNLMQKQTAPAPRLEVNQAPAEPELSLAQAGQESIIPEGTASPSL